MKVNTHWLVVCFYLITNFALSQISFEGRVLDSLTKKPVPFCAIGIKHSTRGCLSNEDGLFRLQSVTNSDTLIINNVTYHIKEIALVKVLTAPVIYISLKEKLLQEVTVYDNTNKLFDLFNHCRNNLNLNKEEQAKAYFVLESEIADQPVELLECYYNARFSNASIYDLAFKNGRVALAPYTDRFFVNRNTSKAISFLSLTNANEHMPAIPFQLSKKQLKKNYRFILKSIVSGTEPLYQIAFEPVQKNGDYFSGEVWIELNSGVLRKINLQVENTNTHPFLPYSNAMGKIEGVSMQITKSYVDIQQAVRPDYLYFDYQLNYHHLHNSTLASENKDTTFNVSSRGVIYFYDYNHQFQIPYFEYDQEAEDYRKITSLTYNEAFWNSTNTLEYSDERKKKIKYLKNNGVLINYRNQIKVNPLFKDKFFENNYIQWSGKKRMSLKKDGIKNDTLAGNYRNQQFLSQRYKLKAQIFLDVNPSGDTLQHFSTTIFDVYDSYYNIAEEPATNCFINIYFDLVEIERRKMEVTIAKSKMNAAQIDALYKSTLKAIEGMSSDYFTKVVRGKNLTELEKWNFIVKQNLAIDNFELFGIKPR